MSIDQRYTTDAIKDAAIVAAIVAAPLSEADIRRIAVAVCDEQERRASHPLRVTAADVRRWIPQ